MFENTSELAPDLEWMLTSGQVDEATLIDHLIRAHYSELFQLALELNGYAPHAHSFTQQTLASAVLQAHQYKGLTSVRVWLFRMALRVFSRSNQHKGDNPITSLPVDLPEMLTRQFYFNQEEVSAILDGRETASLPDEQHPSQEYADDLLHPQRPMSTSSNGEGQSTQPEFENYQPLNEKEIANLNASIQALIAQKRRVKTNRLRLQTFAVVASLLVLVTVLLRSYPLIGAPIDETPPPLPTRLITAVSAVEITANPSPLPSPTPLPAHLVVFTASGGEMLADIARKYGVNLNHLNNLNNIAENQELSRGQQVVIGAGSSRYTLSTTPAPFTPPDLPPPLTLDTEIATILQRVADSSSYWHTLWAEVQFNYYGLFNYIGPPRTLFYQTWLDQTINSSLTLHGGLDGRLSLYDLRTDSSAHIYDFEIEERQITSQAGFTYAFNHEIHNFITPGELSIARHVRPGVKVEELYEIQAIDRVAGREALVLDWRSKTTETRSGVEVVEDSDLGRFWIDTQLGVVLRHQYFYPIVGDFERIVVIEYQVREIVFDVVFSYNLFEPYRELPRRFAQDYLGEPLPEGEILSAAIWDLYSGRPVLSPEPPPASFDPASGQLTFHYKPDDSLVDVYSNGYFLGGVITTDPFFASCARSPNGHLIALAHAAWNLPVEFTLHWFDPQVLNPLHWFNLQDLNPDVVTTPKVLSPSHTKVTDFTFSPDSRSLAYFGCASETECVISLIDLETGDQRQVISLIHGSSLTWSPDGNYLALLGVVASSTDTIDRILVLDLSSGELVYSGELDPITNLPAGDSPTQDWGVHFPRYEINLASCTFPPD
jgi:DNA-directed RNA polymerase specialized sigma24 family protein